MKLTTIRKRALEASSALNALALVGVGAVASVALPTVASAQDYTTGTIVGSVRTDTGEIVTSGSVTVQSNEQGFTQSATIGSDGSFRVPQLPTGVYTVTVSAPGYPSISDSSIAVKAGASNTYVFTIPTATAQAPEGEVIIVTGTTIRANDFAANTTGLTLDIDKLASTVPVGRDLTSLILLAPAATKGDNGFGNVASISGATVAENSYYVNGLNITDFRDFIAPSTVPFEFYRTVDIKTGGLSAEFGRALGGVTSAIVKSGTNDYKAGAVISWEPSGLRSDSPDTYAARNSDDHYESIDANFYISGPLIKDRLFFYGLYSPQYERSGNTSKTLFARVEGKSDSPFYGGKLDAIIADGHRLEAMYFNDRQTTDYRYYRFLSQTTGDIEGFDGGYQTKEGGDNFIATYTGKFAPWFTLSTSYGQNKRVGYQTASPAQSYVGTYVFSDPETGASATKRVAGTVTGNLRDKDKREMFRADADFYFNALGEHHLRIGFDQENLTASENTTYNNDYRYYFAGSYIRRYYYQNDGTFKTRYRAFYLQDSWSMMDDRLNLQLGIRNDAFQNKNELGEVYFDQKNMWGPRIGATYDVFGDKRTKVSAYWGRYFLPVATNTNIRLAGSETYYQQRFAYPTGVSGAVVDEYGVPIGITYNADGSPVLGASLYSRPCPDGAPDVNSCYSITGDGTLHTTESSVSQGLKPSYSDEWILGVSQKLGDFDFGLKYIHRSLGRTLEDVAIDRAIVQYCVDNDIDLGTCTSAYSGFGQYVLANPGETITVAPYDNLGGLLPDTFVLDSAAIGYTKPQRKFDSIQFTFDKPFDGKWGLGGSYTWTRLRGNYEGAVISNINQTDSGLTQDYDQPGFLEGAYGDLANGREHSLKVYGAFAPTERWLIGANFTLESPRKFSCLGNYDNPNSDSPFGYDPEFYYGAFSYWCHNAKATGLEAGDDGLTTDPVLINRGTAFKSDWRSQIDLGVQYNLLELPGSYVRFDVFNVLNSKAKVDFNEFGDLDFAGANAYYKRVTAYQEPRSVRLTLAIRLGEDAN